MERELEVLVRKFERGTITRRELIAALVAVCAAPGAAIAGTAAQKRARIGLAGLDHLALRVSDVQRSKQFYLEHLDVSVINESENEVFLRAGNDWIALFNDRPVTSGIPRQSGRGFDHFSFRTAPPYQFEAMMADLRARGLDPVSPGSTRRIYFRDPDGIVVQLSNERM